VEYDFTAHLEDQLDEISAGESEWKAVLREFWQPFSAKAEETKELKTQEILKEIETFLEPYLFPGADPEKARTCPTCSEGKLGLRVGKFGAFLGCSRYPDCNFTRPLDIPRENADAAGGAATSEPSGLPRLIGKNDAGADMQLKKGPYGLYLEAPGEDAPRRVAIPKGMDPESLTEDRARKLLALPREIGNHPDTGKSISVGIGRYGPYLLHNGKYTSLRDPEEVLSIGLNRAVELVSAAPAFGRAAVTPLRVIGNHPDDNEPIALYSGRYGPYIKHKKLNASLPKSASPDTFTLEEAVTLLAQQADKPARKGKASAKKPAAKKAAPAKSAEKKPAVEKKPVAKKAPARKKKSG
jgi:DNA topoisomerase-1